jgi:hypothetical protein
MADLAMGVSVRAEVGPAETLIQSGFYCSVIVMLDMKGIDLNLLIVLDALLGERSVTRAAARLGYTQPTISGMLARLRDLFGDPLFVRTQRGILPTPRAEARSYR